MNPKYFKELTSTETRNFFNDIDLIIFDCDGVLWLADKIIGNVLKVINGLQEKGKSVCYVSNNSTKSIEKFVLKLKRLGFIYHEDNVFLPPPMVGSYLKDNMSKSQSVYLIGPEAVHFELKKQGIRSFGYGPDPYPFKGSLLDITSKELDVYIQLKENVGAVVISYDEHYNYIKFIKACTYLLNPKCLFVATNADNSFPHSNKKYRIPGTGATIAAIEFATRRKSTILGKPELYIADYLIKKQNVDSKRILMVGDRCDTDILFGNRAGFKTLLVLSGVHKLTDVKKMQSSNDEIHKMSIPMYYTDSVADLLSAVEAIQNKM